MNGKDSEDLSSNQPAGNPNDPSLAPPPSYEELLQKSGGGGGTAPSDPVFPGEDIPINISKEGGVPFDLATEPPPVTVIKIQQKSYGTVSCDPVLNQDPQVLLNYFISNCTKPRMFVSIRGYHYETRYRYVRDANGNERQERYQECVEDFNNSYDVTHLIQEQGTIYSTANAKTGEYLTVPQLMDRYVQSDKNFKSMKLSKFPIWNYGELRSLIKGAIRMTGYSGEIDISFPMNNCMVKVQSDSKIGKVANNFFVRALMVITCLWICVYPVYRAIQENMDGFLRADYHMNLSSRDWFMQNYWLIVANARGPSVFRYTTVQCSPSSSCSSFTN